MFGYDPSDVWPVIIIMSIILAFEWAGGLAVVAMSDSIQGFVMVVSFLCLPVVILRNWGGWKDIDPMTFPRPDFYQTPSAEGEFLPFADAIAILQHLQSQPSARFFNIQISGISGSSGTCDPFLP